MNNFDFKPFEYTFSTIKYSNNTFKLAQTFWIFMHLNNNRYIKIANSIARKLVHVAKTFETKDCETLKRNAISYPGKLTLSLCKVKINSFQAMKQIFVDIFFFKSRFFFWMIFLLDKTETLECYLLFVHYPFKNFLILKSCIKLTFYSSP